VSVGHLIELEKQGFGNESTRVAIPVGQEGKTVGTNLIRLAKISTELPVNRIQKDYASDAKGDGLRLKKEDVEVLKTLELSLPDPPLGFTGRSAERQGGHKRGMFDQPKNLDH